MVIDKIYGEYKLKCISVDKNYLPVDLETVKHYVGASFTESDAVIRDVVIKSCEQVELMTYKSVLRRTWELTHCRSDIILKMPPIRNIISVFYKGLKKWHKILFDDIKETLINDGERRIVVPKFKENQMVKVIYVAGSKMLQEGDNIDNRFAMSYATTQLLLKLCLMHYSKMRTKHFNEEIGLLSLCENYCSGWNDPIF